MILVLLLLFFVFFLGCGATFICRFLGSLLPQYMSLCNSQFVPQKKFVCPFVGLHCGCVPPI